MFAQCVGLIHNQEGTYTYSMETELIHWIYKDVHRRRGVLLWGELEMGNVADRESHISFA